MNNYKFSIGQEVEIITAVRFKGVPFKIVGRAMTFQGKEKAYELYELDVEGRIIKLSVNELKGR